MAENIQAQQQKAAVQEKKSAIQETALCKHCGSALDSESAFCPSCGEKIVGEEYTCEFCQTKTSKEFCPHCGRRVIPVLCPKCGTPGIYDVCENCGAIINPVLEKTFAKEAPVELAIMSEDEAKEIETEFKTMESNGSAEFKAFQKKLIERQILLEEKDYFNKREKRIVKTFGSSPFTVELPDPEEEAFRMKAYAALEKTVIEREEKDIEAELNKLFPPVDTAVENEKLAEIERNRVEMEQKFNEALAKVNNEVEVFRIEEERKRVEEELRRRQEEERREAERRREIERQRLEEERRKKRFQGNYYHVSHNGMLTAELRIGSDRADCWYRCTVCGRATVAYSVSINGDNITLTGGRKLGDYCSFAEYKLVENYNGTVNSSGTILSGCWYNNGMSVPIVFYKL